MSSPKILVFDGDRLTRWSLGEALRQDKYQVSEAASWDEALDFAGTAEFRLILADVEIQDDQSLPRLRKMQALQPSAVILILSSDPVDQTEAALRSLGRFRVIEKPYALEAVKSLVSEALEDKLQGRSRS